MQFFVGTSGYSYKEWKGTFYPEKLPAKEMLSFYAQRFSTVEINNTFYRMPAPSVLESWATQVPENFRFVLKTPQAITHFKRLKDVEDPTERFLQVASVLKGRLGPLLVQLPPNFKKDVARLGGFLDLIPAGTAVAFEFRHESWFDDEVFDRLRSKSCVLCVADSEDLPAPELINTAPWGMLRLRREEYSKQRLVEWIDKARSQKWDTAYVFFKHEDSGTAPKFAMRFLELVSS
ncbi:MAG TPA: DUF72 domain-containing protein [Planctomycetaceae bacterium]|nr:DUF72 domain-containing protein [Planctomycetaceae bacterium]